MPTAHTHTLKWWNDCFVVKWNKNTEPCVLQMSKLNFNFGFSRSICFLWVFVFHHSQLPAQKWKKLPRSLSEKWNPFCSCPPERYDPQLHSTCHYIVNHYVKIWYVRLGCKNMRTLKEQTEKIQKFSLPRTKVRTIKNWIGNHLIAFIERYC